MNSSQEKNAGGVISMICLLCCLVSIIVYLSIHSVKMVRQIDQMRITISEQSQSIDALAKTVSVHEQAVRSSNAVIEQQNKEILRLKSASQDKR